MARVSSGRLIMGGILTVGGLAAVILGMLSYPLLPAVGSVAGPTLAMGLGAFLLVVGIIIGLQAFSRDEGPVPTVPAHVAFSAKPEARDLEPPPRAAPPPARAPRHAPSPEVARIDEEIRDLTRQINKAGVMLATGKLSKEGYTQYVEDLKKKRGDLEAARVDLELHHRKHAL